ncbi:hypothetical protein [Mycobacterium colombiense]|nr:hypothetical protein [Mycobacterium colombiense]
MATAKQLAARRKFAKAARKKAGKVGAAAASRKKQPKKVRKS